MGKKAIGEFFNPIRSFIPSLAILFFLFSQNLQAQTKTTEISSTPEPQHYEFNFCDGFALINLAQFSGSDTALSWDIEAYDFLNPHLGFGCSMSNYNLDGFYHPDPAGDPSMIKDVTVGFLSMQVCSKYYFGEAGIRPYLSGAVGATLYTVSLYNPETVGLIEGGPDSSDLVYKVFPSLGFGCGAEVQISKGFGLFAQGKYNFVFTDQGTPAFMPLEAGIDIAY